ncbi:serine/threonine protein kinase [Streptomyces davaonensis JCM 4913]|uniref:Serine/threonine protein kinase n=1 Tax=Streptomyces davaonensis (strain DSM 101723 / JCM 4913 / KCC S-0913 / 768) TaxID=1214101 RepID=K4R4H1_STRDJ|nr:protein kinase [Streptomyces davaonensis]CCK28022.1 serine/threonine protein kinase [Streptomyces davaonensis JCM 4913]
MDDYAGRVLADRYRLPLPPSDEYELTETRAFDTYSGQEVLVRQVPLPEVVEAEVLDAEGLPDGFTARERGAGRRPSPRGSTRRPTEPAVRRAVEAAQAAARIPDHPRLDQVFDVFAEGGSLWIVSELVPARPLAALLAEKPLTPYRAAEVASDVLMALRVLHAHGWVHRNITARTVLVCDDGRVMLTGLAVGAAEEALCGYDPVPPEDGGDGAGYGGPGAGSSGAGAVGPGGVGGTGAAVSVEVDPEGARRAAIEARAAGGLPPAGAADAGGGGGGTGVPARRAVESGGDIRAARAGAIAAYRAGARAAARVQQAEQTGRAALPGARPAPDTNGATQPPYASESGAERPPYPSPNGAAQSPYPSANGAQQHPSAPAAGPPGQIADPYGVRAASWHGAAPRTGTGPALPEGGTRHPGGPDRTALPPAAPGAQPTAPAGPRRTGTPVPGRSGPVDGGFAVPGHTAPPAGPRGTGAPVPGQAGPAGFVAPHSGAPAIPGPAGATHPGSPVPAAGTHAPGTPTPGAPTRWNDLAATAPLPRGPATALAAERARQARMAVVGPVTERWAPEQAGPVHENWQLAAPIGPATDLWALGALLFRAVQGHAPYPEESTAELVQMVCAEPPAFAEECGPLRPVVESLLRQDPTERLDFEELRGWLRSLVRSAPEPEAGAHVVAAPPVDASRLPVVRRRGELVRRRRAGLPAHHGRHKRAREEARSPRSLGRTLLVLILLLMAGAVAYAMLFMPKSDTDAAGGDDTDRTGASGQVSPAPEASSEPRPDQTSPGGGEKSPTESAGSTGSQTTGPDVADGFELRTDDEGFRVAVANGWDRSGKNGRGQVVYAHGDFELIVVPGRDTTAEYGDDPMAYQREEEPELQPYRDSSWATSTGLKTIEVGGRTMAEGQFTWTDDAGRERFVRNLAILIGDRYHVVQIRGPEAERDEVTRLFEQASATYQVTG